MKTLVAGLVGGSALLKEWEPEWRQRFGEEKGEVERKTSTPAMELRIRADVPSLRVYCRFGEFCSHAGDWEDDEKSQCFLYASYAMLLRRNGGKRRWLIGLV